MNGFKEGAAGDAFSDDDVDDEDEEGGGDVAESAVDEVADDIQSASTEGSTENTSMAEGGLPWLYRRDSITDGREKTVQLHLQSSTLDEQRDARAAVEKQLGESVKKADLREAAVLVGLRHVDEVADQLREWGYDVD
ncbi:hypothetical protein [Halorussus marinus]|uniref:hypothetical protein n=1 Tax=Halorussus marinus TaxID=2505976 RepID=UPI00106E2DCD|nr:hypothetical protein [Halorussus marinus]